MDGVFALTLQSCGSQFANPPQAAAAGKTMFLFDCFRCGSFRSFLLSSSILSWQMQSLQANQ